MTSCRPSHAPLTAKSLSSSLLVTLIFILNLIDKATPRARMIIPPMRSSYWREGVSSEGIDAPVNINDELLNCGGYDHQWNVMKGACGACGDKSGAIHENEYPGKYSRFPPQRIYRTSRGPQDLINNNVLDIISVTIYITANKLGYFVFRLCPHRDGPSLPATYVDLADCFSRHAPLLIQDVNATRFYPGSRGGFHDLHLEIPANVTCVHCILQWTYVTGYREGRNDQCEPCLGCGPQEQYANCADIQILPIGAILTKDENGNSFITSTTPPIPSTTQTRPPPTFSPPPLRTTTKRIIPRTPSTGRMTTQTPSNSLTPCTPSADIVRCEARAIQRLVPDGNKWCLENCKSGNCRADFCDCFCQYPGFKISIDPSAFDLKTPSRGSQNSNSSLGKYLCYKPLPLWRRMPGINGWCATKCPANCANMCSLQVCP